MKSLWQPNTHFAESKGTVIQPKKYTFNTTYKGLHVWKGWNRPCGWQDEDADQSERGQLELPLTALD